MQEKKNIAKVPRERKLKIQSPQEGTKRLKEWEVLLSKLPYCECNKSQGELTESSGYVNDNEEVFGDSIFVYSTKDVLSYHKTAYMILYFCFLNNGKFKIEDGGNMFTEKESWEDPIAVYLSEVAKDGGQRESWVEGYQLITEILKNAFSQRIPEVPDAYKKPVEIFEIDDPKIEKALDEWAETFRSLKYCEVMTYEEATRNWGSPAEFALWIIYFTSPGVYGINQTHDLFAGWLPEYDDRGKEENLHRIEVKFKEISDLPKIYEQIKAELIAAWKEI